MRRINLFSYFLLRYNPEQIASHRYMFETYFHGHGYGSVRFWVISVYYWNNEDGYIVTLILCINGTASIYYNGVTAII